MDRGESLYRRTILALNALAQLRKEYDHQKGKDGSIFDTYVLSQLSELEGMLRQIAKGGMH